MPLHFPGITTFQLTMDDEEMLTIHAGLLNAGAGLWSERVVRYHSAS